MILAGAGVYANSLHNPFVLDDEGAILANEQMRTLLSWDVFTPERELQVAGRPAVNVTFAVNYALGGLSPTGYHVGNIAIHIACALLLFGIVRRLLARARAGWIGDAASGLAFAIALLWLVHPLNSEPVDYITERTESLMALFYLLTCYASIRSVDGPRRRAWASLAVVACALGMASKESMVTSPVMVVLIDAIFLFESARAAVRARWRFYAALAATWVLLAALLASGPRSASAGGGAGVSAWTYLLNQPPLIARYLWLVVWPRSLVAYYGWPADVTLGAVLPYAILIVALLALTLMLLARRPQAGFLGAWFFITLAPASSIVPIATEVGAERRMYLPVAAVLTAIVLGATWCGRRLLASRRWRQVVGASALAVAVLTLAVRTVSRNREYRSAVAITEVTVARYPSPAGHHAFAEALLAAGRREEALDELHAALPGAPRAHYTLGVELFKDRRYNEAIHELSAFIAKQPRHVNVINAHGYLGQAYAARQDWPAAIEQFRLLLEITPDNPAAEHSLADILVSAERYAEAISHYRKYLGENPNDGDALNHLGMALGQTGQMREAVTALRQAVSVDPTNGAAHHNLALALYQTGDLPAAIQEAQLDVRLQPDSEESRELLRGLLAERSHRP